MIKIIILLYSVFLSVHMFSQKNKDFLFLKKELMQHQYLFKTLNKEIFKKNIQKAKLKRNLLSRWDIDDLLSSYKELNLKTLSNDEEIRFIKFKVIADKIYIVKIAAQYRFLLGEEVTKIGNLSTKNLKQKIQKTFYLPNTKNVAKFIEKNLGEVSFLKFINCIQNDSIKIETKNFKEKIPVFSEKFIEIKPETPIFKNRKPNIWFWSYGINFGQQVYLKFNQILSASHLKKMKDSLNWSNYKYAKTYHIPIQSTYNALKFTDLTNKLHLKFSNKRYKKLILDFRDTQSGTLNDLDFFISQLRKIKKLRKKNRIFVLFNKYTNNASLKYIKSLQKYFKPILVGESTYGTTSDSNEIKIIELPISKIKIQIPIKHQTEIEIIPNIKVIPSLQQTIKGIDPVLNKCIE